MGTNGTLQSTWLYPTNIFARRAKGEEMKRKKKLNFWVLLPKLSIATASVFAVYIAHREYTGTGNITGLSAVVPLAIVVYYVIGQAVESIFEEKRKD